MSSGELIAVVHDDAVERATIAGSLRRRGFVALEAASIDELDAGDVNLLVLACASRDELAAALSSLPAPSRRPPPPVLVIGEGELDAAAALSAGAADYVAATAPEEELCARVEARVSGQRALSSLSRREHSAQMLLELTRALSSATELRDILFLVVKRVAEVIDVERVSIVLCGDEGRAYVIAASDDEKLRDLPIELKDYPEIRRVLETGEPLTIADAGRHPLLSLARMSLPPRFRSLMLYPIRYQDRAMGVLFLRFAELRTLDSDDDLVLGAVANATGIALRNATLLSSLRDQSKSAQVEAQKQVAALQRYVDFFDSSADGILVVTLAGQVLFCNPAATEITGRAREELLGCNFERLLSRDGRRRFAEVRKGFADGEFPSNVDLAIRTATGKRRVLNVSFSSVLREEQSVIVSLRDVTEERALARELARTKEFLQHVIDSSVDAIVSADMKGKVLLYNPAAERTYGYPASDVIGAMNVEDLYPEGVARDIMRRIRSEAHGGPGVLTGFETELLGKDGVRIPVQLSAALIMHRGRPIGSVGVFKDLRAKRQIEARLARAQQELAVQEKKAFIAELAGATAHELNQPLTTVMGYAGLLEQQLAKLEGQPRLKRASAAIVRETERMAEIVRKIGKLTRYESKAYVGETKIIDIERSIDSEPPATEL